MIRKCTILEININWGTITEFILRKIKLFVYNRDSDSVIKLYVYEKIWKIYVKKTNEK